jgi:hypothetical protein
MMMKRRGREKAQLEEGQHRRQLCKLVIQEGSYVW